MRSSGVAGDGWKGEVARRNGRLLLLRVVCMRAAWEALVGTLCPALGLEFSFFAELFIITLY